MYYEGKVIFTFFSYDTQIYMYLGSLMFYSTWSIFSFELLIKAYLCDICMLYIIHHIYSQYSFYKVSSYASTSLSISVKKIFEYIDEIFAIFLFG